MTELADFLPWVLPGLLECPDMLAEQAVRDAAIDFCRRTRIWRHTYTMQYTGTPLQIIGAAGDAVAFEIDNVWYDGSPVDRIQWGNYRAHGGHCDIGYLTQALPGRMQLTEQNCGGCFEIGVYLCPSNDAEEIPDFLFNIHRQALVDGAKGTLMAIPAQAFTNLQLAAYHTAAFERAKDRHFDANTAGQQRAPSRVKMRFF